MLKEVKHEKRFVAKNAVDKFVEYFSPVKAAKRMRARLALEVFGGYDAAGRKKRSLKEWNPFGSDPDGDILGDLNDMRNRSRDLVRNNGLAAGAIKTKVTNVVGTGMRFQSRIDREFLGIDDDTADAWEAAAEREWHLFWDSPNTDIARTLSGNARLRQIYQQAKENGEALMLLPRVKRDGSVYDLKVQIIEADRLSNKDNVADSDKMAGGIERDDNGAPKKYHFLKHHPGAMGSISNEWESRDAFGEKTGLPNVIHYFNQTRPGQSRGVPDLAPVIELFKQLGRYTESEIMAAVISGMFTVFIESENGEGGFDYTNLQDETGQSSDDRDIKLGNGLVIELANGEKIHDTNPGRPNSSFDPFVLAIMRQIGSALEIPFEILIKHFTASYSAARAALLSFWQYVLSERKMLEDIVLKPILEVWMFEAVAKGRIYAPGFFNDQAIRAAYLGCKFIGPSKGQINESVEVKAAKEKVDAGFSTLADETAALTGGDWETNHKQQVKERKKRLADGLIQEEKPAQQTPPPNGGSQDGE
ncbi:MAG: phage portal protein [Gammaproteobacteria bacterium]